MVIVTIYSFIWCFQLMVFSNNRKLDGVFNIFFFHPFLGKIPILTI